MASTSTSTSTTTTETENSTQTIPITLTSSSSSPSLSIPNVPYLIPSNWKRSHLSTLVNRVLNTSNQDGDSHLTIPFDFIIDGKLLIGSIHNYLNTNNLTVEETLDIQYVPSTLPPKYQAAFQQDDWISSVDAAKDGLFLTSSYDSTFRIFSTSNTTSPLLTFSTSHSTSPNPSLTNALWLSNSQSSSSKMVTSGMDGILRLWQFNDLPTDTTTSDSMDIDSTSTSTLPKVSNPKLIWSGLSSKSSSTITSLSRSRNGKYLLSGTTDGCISLFDTTTSPSSTSDSIDFIPYDPENPIKNQDEEEEEVEIEEERSRKKRKLKKNLKKSAQDQLKSYKSPELNVWHVEPSIVNVLNSRKGSQNVPGRNSRVSKVLFSKEFIDDDEDEEKCLESCFSSGWDGCVKEWDFKDGGRSKGIKSSDKVLSCMDQLAPIGSSTSTLVTGNMDRSISVWDMRSATTNISLQLPASHSKPVSSIKCHPLSSNLFASGSHDGTIKIWDIRSSKQALFSLDSNQDQNKTNRNGNGNGDGGLGMNEGEGEKVLTLDWTRDGQTIVSGGEDKKLNVWKGEGIGKSLE